MLSWTIFKRALRMVLDDLPGAVRVSALPYGLLAAVTVYFSDIVNSATLSIGMDEAGMPAWPDGFVAAVLILNLVQMVVVLWIAVAWHRHVLAGETAAGIAPPLHGGRMLGYLGRSLLLGLLVLACVLAVMLALSFSPAIAVPVAFILAAVVFYRMGVILPAGAIDAPISMTEAWRATAGQTGTVLGLAVLTFALSLLLQLPAWLDAAMSVPPGPPGSPEAREAALAAAGSPVSVIYGLVVGWILLMLGISILSALYERFVARRPVD